MNNRLPVVLVTGSNGQLGTSLKHCAFAKSVNAFFLPRHELDVSNADAIRAVIEKYRPEVIVNTAAYTAVDLAETETEQALLANYKGAENLAIACDAYRIKLIQVSTDYIFDGKAASPYLEAQAAHPINFYGESKWQGEQAVRRYCENHLILRISGVFSEYGTNFYKTILRLAKDREELSIVSDQITCPTYAGDIADTIFKLVKLENVRGTYHYCSSHSTSWFDFANKIIAAAKEQDQNFKVKLIKPILTSEYITKASRPVYSVLDCTKFIKDTNIAQPNWLDAIQKLKLQGLN